MKRKIIAIIFGLMCISSSAKACAGCIDFGVATMQGTIQGVFFKVLELKLVAQLTLMNFKLKSAMETAEGFNSTTATQIKNLRSYQSLRQQEMTFLMQQNNKLQSIANEIRGIN